MRIAVVLEVLIQRNGLREYLCEVLTKGHYNSTRGMFIHAPIAQLDRVTDYECKRGDSGNLL